MKTKPNERDMGILADLLNALNRYMLNANSRSQEERSSDINEREFVGNLIYVMAMYSADIVEGNRFMSTLSELANDGKFLDFVTRQMSNMGTAMAMIDRECAATH